MGLPQSSQPQLFGMLVSSRPLRRLDESRRQGLDCSITPACTSASIAKRFPGGLLPSSHSLVASGRSPPTHKMYTTLTGLRRHSVHP